MSTTDTPHAHAHFSRNTALNSLIDGVLAAPDGHDPHAWLKLVKPRSLVRSKAARAKLLEWLAVRKQLHAGTISHTPADHKLAALRERMSDAGIDGFIVPHADEYQCEYTPACAHRLAWLTGFTGSAGEAIVLADKAAVFSDGRYTLQLAAQTDEKLYVRLNSTEVTPAAWIAENLKEGASLGYDPWLFTPAQRDKLKEAVKKACGKLVACQSNPVDAIWHDQPAAPISPIVAHGIEYAGKAAAEKVSELVAQLKAGKADAVVLTAPDSVAWLLNIRGADVNCTPLPLCFAIVRTDGSVQLFADPRKLTAATRKHLGKTVTVSPRESLPKALDKLGKQGLTVQVDPAVAACFIVDRLDDSGATVKRLADPCKLAKACKNAVELSGTRAAHIRDGAALTRFLFWAKTQSAKGNFTEMQAQDKLDAMRAAEDLFQDLSFPTIMGAGANGAIVHYRSTEATNAAIQSGNLLLVDSGAQYLDGTTDVTRTVAIGEPTAEMRDRFTRVLKGHIALARVRFPKRTAGDNLDVLARLFLWQAGLDYGHGTGHGVGSYLGVHEGPQSIRPGNNATSLKPGMIVSNEPGYYKAGEYGIRIENLIVVSELPAIDGGEQAMFGFETITMAPIDLDLVELSLMTPDEVAWLNAYHAEVHNKLTPLLDADTAAWLAQATRPLKPACPLAHAPK